MPVWLMAMGREFLYGVMILTIMLFVWDSLRRR